MLSEHGQATVEWTGLVLLVAVALGALATLVPRVDGRSLGGAVAHAITCSARGGCAAERGAPRRVERAERVAPRRVERAERADLRPARPRVSAPRTTAPVQALRGVREVAKRAWIVCLGYRRFLYERDHPRGPMEGMPVDEALDIANDCLNPFGFFGED
jgi:hypothetical protein